MLARRVRSLHRTIVGVHGFSVRGPRTTDEFEVSFYDGFRNRLKPKRPSNWELMGVAKSLFYMRWVVTPPERAGRGNRGGGVTTQQMETQCMGWDFRMVGHDPTNDQRIGNSFFLFTISASSGAVFASFRVGGSRPPRVWEPSFFFAKP